MSQAHDIALEAIKKKRLVDHKGKVREVFVKSHTKEGKRVDDVLKMSKEDWEKKHPNEDYMTHARISMVKHKNKK